MRSGTPGVSGDERVECFWMSLVCISKRYFRMRIRLYSRIMLTCDRIRLFQVCDRAEFCNLMRGRRREMLVLERVCSFEVCLDAKRGPLRTSVPEKTARSDDISHVNLFVAWNRLAKSTKLLISCLLEGHTEKVSSMSLDDKYVRARKE